MPGSAALLHAYQSPFGIANGDEATNHWQVEAGYAPWWIHPRLLISLYRPVSAATHQLDAWLWPDSAVLQHAHSLAWAFALVLAVTALYRSVMGVTTVAGVAALFCTRSTRRTGLRSAGSRTATRSCARCSVCSRCSRITARASDR